MNRYTCTCLQIHELRVCTYAFPCIYYANVRIRLDANKFQPRRDSVWLIFGYCRSQRCRRQVSPTEIWRNNISAVGRKKNCILHLYFKYTEQFILFVAIRLTARYPRQSGDKYFLINFVRILRTKTAVLVRHDVDRSKIIYVFVHRCVVKISFNHCTRCEYRNIVSLKRERIYVYTFIWFLILLLSNYLFEKIETKKLTDIKRKVPVYYRSFFPFAIRIYIYIFIFHFFETLYFRHRSEFDKRRSTINSVSKKKV